MSRDVWNQIKSSKRFYVYLYRRLINVLIFSLLLNLVLSYVGLHLFFKRPPRVAYSTNGATPPTKLSPLTAPNESQVPLLSSSPQGPTDPVKVVPN